MAARHRNLECPMCKRMMRSNNLKRHWKNKHKMFDMELTVKVEGKAKADRSMSSTDDLKMEILENNEIYSEKIQLGERINKVLLETNAKEESLSRQHKEALDLYQRKRLCFSLDDKITLFNW